LLTGFPFLPSRIVIPIWADSGATAFSHEVLQTVWPSSVRNLDFLVQADRVLIVSEVGANEILRVFTGQFTTLNLAFNKQRARCD
jgi:hypothetical protein